MSTIACGCDPEAGWKCTRHLLTPAPLTDRLRASLQSAAREVSRSHDKIALLTLELKDRDETIAALHVQIADLKARLLGQNHNPNLVYTHQHTGQEVI